jgi:hypothetical protein
MHKKEVDAYFSDPKCYYCIMSEWEVNSYILFY